MTKGSDNLCHNANTEKNTSKRRLGTTMLPSPANRTIHMRLMYVYGPSVKASPSNPIYTHTYICISTER